MDLPILAHTNVKGVLQNVQVVNFPGNALAANKLSGEFRGYNVFAGHSGGNCVDIEHVANPTRFYGLVASGCTTGLNLFTSKSEEFHGASVFHNTIDVSVTGTRPSTEAYVLFDGLQLGHSDRENMYLDQQNETVICADNCVFTGAQENCPSGLDCGAALVIGPDATTAAGGLTPVIAQFNQGVFAAAASVGTDILFETSITGNTPCTCRVALGGAMLDITTGAPSTNNQALLSGQTTYAPPTFANAASVGVPLSLNPAELGIGLSTDTEGAPNGPGLKFRVKCGTNSGTVKLVLLAGISTTESAMADNIGSGVSQCIH